MKAEKFPMVLANYAEDRQYSPDRLWHCREIAKFCAAYRAAKIPVALYGFPSWSTSDALDAYAWRYVGKHVDAIAVSYYFEAPDGDLTIEDCRRIAVLNRKAKRYGKDIYFVVSPQTHGGVDVTSAKNLQLKTYLASFDLEGIIVWGANPASRANLATVAAYQNAVNEQ